MQVHTRKTWGPVWIQPSHWLMSSSVIRSYIESIEIKLWPGKTKSLSVICTVCVCVFLSLYKITSSVHDAASQFTYSVYSLHLTRLRWLLMRHWYKLTPMILSDAARLHITFSLAPISSWHFWRRVKWMAKEFGADRQTTDRRTHEILWFFL